jgi:VWFA-related protein
MRLARFTNSILAALFLYSVSSASILAQSTSPHGAQEGQGRLVFTVLDSQSEPAELSIENLRLLLDKKPQQLIALRKLEEQPLSLAILIDTSVSQERTLPEQKRAADAFVQAVMRPAKDQVAVVTFTGKMVVEQGFTNDLSLVRGAIARARFVPPPGYVGRGTVIQGPPPSIPPANLQIGATAIWDAVWNTTEDLLVSAPVDNRKAIILLTDGADTASKKRMREAIEDSVAANVKIYAIGIGDRNDFGIDEGALRKLTDQTGGRAFIPKKGQDLTNIFAEIAQGLRNQYELTYRLDVGCRNLFQSVRLEITHPVLRPKSLRISYQRISAQTAK